MILFWGSCFVYHIVPALLGFIVILIQGKGYDDILVNGAVSVTFSFGRMIETH